MQTTIVHPRSPLGALFLSLLILPGTGSMYGGRPVAGGAFLGAWIALWVLLLTGTYTAPAVLLALLVIAVWSPVHAFRSARAWNRDHGIES